MAKGAEGDVVLEVTENAAREETYPLETNRLWAQTIYLLLRI